MSLWYPCAYCTKDLKCTKYSDDKVTSYCLLGPCNDETKSNADRIRQMTDEELAEWVWGAETSGRAYGPRGKKSWLDWLNSPAEKGERE